MNEQEFLFEVSWEVCNKVGGIYTVLQSKLQQVKNNFGKNYILIGPWYEHSKDFIEYTENSSDFLGVIKNKLAAKNILCHIGYWNTDGKPTVILVDFKQRYKIDSLLYNLWADFGIDSLASNYDYHEPILFSTAAGEVICTLAEEILAQNKKVIAHFHEWMCGAGLLYLKKYGDKIATVFTTHATVLGRALAHDNQSIYNLPPAFDPAAEARKRGVFAKHSLEKATAREADCFTVVSSITADESRIMLGKYPDKIVLNGLNIEEERNRILPGKKTEIRAKLLQVANKITGKTIDDNALLWITSGRYEFHNKGFDLLLKTLAKLEEKLTEKSPPIIMLVLVAAAWHNKNDALAEIDLSKESAQVNAVGIATHRVYNPADDNIIKLCNELNFKKPDRKIHIVFSDAYLQGDDGVFDISYEQILASCDLSIFPSFYEPWGYTPLESIVFSTPTITTDLSGFGYWVNNLKQDHADAIFVLKRKDCDEQRAISDLSEYLYTVIGRDHEQNYTDTVRAKALAIANLANWNIFYQDYLDAYARALKFNKLSHIEFNADGQDNIFVTSIHDAEVTKPRFHSFQYECILPEKLKDLRRLAYNFWWSWHEDAKAIFQKIDPILWEQVRHNPGNFLNLVSSQALQNAADNEDYIWLYDRVIGDFNAYIKVAEDSTKKTIAYFCMEYGIDECLPIYSGGLGILAGDYLKAASDLRVPIVAVGLLYKRGYFKQLINSNGEQEALYENWSSNQIPMSRVNEASGKILLFGVEVLGRTIYVQVWKVNVGNVSLYLLDTDVNENSPNDRGITDSLYGGSREIRLLQEMILGIGGVRLLEEKLNIKPVLYHLNEGHSAFLLLDRIRILFHQGYSFDEACEIVRSSSVFTTHTPVPAGNETFSEELISKYLQDYASSRLGITFDKLFNLACDSCNKLKVFSMTVLALRLTLGANAVSRLHRKVACSMWNAIWPSYLECEVPIGVVTNGVHLASWLGGAMKLLYNDYLPNNWMDRQSDLNVWEKVKTIDNAEIWQAHQSQKDKLLKIVKKLLVEQYTLRNESKKLINSSLQCLTSNTLLLGLSRRFTAYKRNDLFLRDRERLSKLLTDEQTPVVILMAGKAHPDDTGGRELIHEIIETLRLDIFNGHIVFIEEYNISLAELLVQGVDVWLNTPILGREACGTSGMKAGINGGINFSTKDGWWEEAYNENIGWQVESFPTITEADKRNDIESRYLLETLETQIVPLYYKTNRSGFNPEWVDKMKASIALVACQYNTSRMVEDYVNKFYEPVVLRHEQLMQNNAIELKNIVFWKKDILERFNTVKIKAIFVNGIQNGKITSSGKLKIKLLLFLGKLEPEELKVEFVLSKSDNHCAEPVIASLRHVGTFDNGVLTYVTEYQITEPGFYSYAIRVLPHNPMLFQSQDIGLVYWG
jgi:glycogen phosphorylase/synthase